MKHRTLRCAAETLVLLLIAAMAVFLAAGLHQRAPDGTLSTLSTGWYQLTDGVSLSAPYGIAKMVCMVIR